MSMTVGGAVSAVVTALSSVTNIGRVHNRRRALKTDQDIHGAFWDDANNRLSGAFVSVSAIQPSSQELNRQIGAVGSVVQYAVRVELFRSLIDAQESEVDFRELVESVLRKIKAARVYSESSSQTAPEASLNMIALADRVLMHYAEVTFQIGGRAAY